MVIPQSLSFTFNSDEISAHLLFYCYFKSIKKMDYQRNFLLFINIDTILFFLGVHIIAVAPTTRCQFPRPPLLLPSPSASFTTIIISITLFSKTTCIPATQLLSMAVGSFTTLSDAMSVAFLDFHHYDYHHATVTNSTSPTASSIISFTFNTWPP